MKNECGSSGAFFCYMSQLLTVVACLFVCLFVLCFFWASTTKVIKPEKHPFRSHTYESQVYVVWSYCNSSVVYIKLVIFANCGPGNLCPFTLLGPQKLKSFCQKIFVSINHRCSIWQGAARQSLTDQSQAELLPPAAALALPDQATGCESSSACDWSVKGWRAAPWSCRGVYKPRSRARASILLPSFTSINVTLTVSTCPAVAREAKSKSRSSRAGLHKKFLLLAWKWL